MLLRLKHNILEPRAADSGSGFQTKASAHMLAQTKEIVGAKHGAVNDVMLEIASTRALWVRDVSRTQSEKCRKLCPIVSEISTREVECNEIYDAVIDGHLFSSGYFF